MYVWFYKMAYQNGVAETGYFRSNSREAVTAAKQLYDYLGEGFEIESLQFNGEIIDVAGTPPYRADDNFGAFKAV